MKYLSISCCSRKITQGTLLLCQALLILCPFCGKRSFDFGRSSRFIEPHYRMYQDNECALVDESMLKKCEEDDDFLSENPPLASSVSEAMFTYGTSPGFRQYH